jgi:hypothetical protein
MEFLVKLLNEEKWGEWGDEWEHKNAEYHFQVIRRPIPWETICSEMKCPFDRVLEAEETNGKCVVVYDPWIRKDRVMWRCTNDDCWELVYRRNIQCENCCIVGWCVE